MDANEELIADKRHGILFCIALSIRYHQRREGWLDRWDKVGKAVAVVGGASVISNALGNFHVWVAVAITLTSAFSLVFGVAQRARQHHDLRKRYARLESEILSIAAPTCDDLDRFKGQITMIEADEPPPLSIIAQLSHNDLVVGRGQFDQVHPVPLHKMILGHFFDMAAVPKKSLPKEAPA